MSSIVNSIVGGVSGNAGGAGLNYKADAANLLNPATTDQANQQYGNVQQGLGNQQAFLNAVQAQNGLANQSNVFNQMQGVANGTGPNPAQAMLNQSTAQNVANQGALMAGQRGAAGNVGLMGRQIAQQGANTQQQAAGQAATMQANQQLNALNQMGGLATNQANQQANATNAYTNAAQGAQSNILGAIGAQNQAAVGNVAAQNGANAGVAGIAAKGQQDMFGNLMGGIGSGLMMAQGGGVGGTTEVQPSTGATNAPQSNVGKWLQNNPNLVGDNSQQSQTALGQGSNQMGKAMGKGLGSLFSGSAPSTGLMAGGAGDMAAAAPLMVAAKGGKVPALVSPGEKYLKPTDVEKVKDGKNPMSVGEKIPGKPKVAGAKNDYANDTVSKTLESGGIVLPRSVTQAKDAPEKAAAFVRAVMAKQGLK